MHLEVLTEAKGWSRHLCMSPVLDPRPETNTSRELAQPPLWVRPSDFECESAIESFEPSTSTTTRWRTLSGRCQ